MRQMEVGEFPRKNYHRQRREIKEVANGLRLRYKSIPPLKEAGDFDGAEFYGFCDDFEENKGLWHLGIDEDLRCRGMELDIFNEDSGGGWKDAQMKYGRPKADLERRISLSICF